MGAVGFEGSWLVRGSALQVIDSPQRRGLMEEPLWIEQYRRLTAQHH